MKLIVCGSRSFRDYGRLAATLDRLLVNVVARGEGVVIISGGAWGADRLGEKYAQDRGFEVMRMPAQWEVFGRSAGMRRNEAMIVLADAVVAFWDGASSGTGHMIRLGKVKGVPMRVVKGK